MRRRGSVHEVGGAVARVGGPSRPRTPERSARRGTRFAGRRAMGARSAVGLAAALWCGLALGARLPPGAALVALALGVLLAAWPRSLPRWDALLVTTLAFLSLGLARAGAERALQVSREGAVPAAGVTARGVAVVEEPPRREGD